MFRYELLSNSSLIFEVEDKKVSEIAPVSDLAYFTLYQLYFSVT